jgi:hypothetical protein
MKVFALMVTESEKVKRVVVSKYSWQKVYHSTYLLDRRNKFPLPDGWPG